VRKKVRKNCPVCGVESTAGLIHRWHKEAHRKKGYVVGELTEMAKATMEQNRIKAIICEAVDEARQGDGWRSKPKTRKEYHRAYYWEHADRRRKQRRESKALRQRVRPLVAALCHAVDLGRLSARW
jgi:endogenous inhibitor of DNA gyrase (YacG/DUF329 family)